MGRINAAVPGIFKAVAGDLHFSIQHGRLSRLDIRIIFIFAKRGEIYTRIFNFAKSE